MVVVGAALFAFIMGDLLTSGSSLNRKSQTVVAEINNKKVGYQEYQKILTYLENISKSQYQVTTLNEEMYERIRTQAWQDILQEYVLTRELDKLGIAVPDEEFSDLVQGQDPHPYIKQLFQNPETGTIDRLQLTNFIRRIGELPESQKLMWSYYENLITKERLFNKYQTLIRKGLYVNKLQAEERGIEMNTAVDFSFTQKPYTAISDSTISVNEADLKTYYKIHKEQYKQEETRNLMYVAIEVVPFERDFLDAENWVKDILPDFKEVEDVRQFVNFNSPPYNPANYKKGELPDTLDEFMFNAEIGDVYGPYFEDNAYKIAKLAEINYLPDSVRVSHIMLPVDQNNIMQMQTLADSLAELATKGYSFSTLVEQNSADISAGPGGDIGWIKENNNAYTQMFIDSCFYAEKEDVKITYNENSLHIVKITDKSKPVKKVQVGIIYREVEPGGQTDQHFYTKAVEFASSVHSVEDFETVAKNKNLTLVPVYDINPMDNNVQGLEQSRSIVHWAFKAEEGELMKDIKNYGGKYVVAMVTKVNNKGYTPLEDIEENIKAEVIKQKKAELIIDEINNTDAASIDELAEKLGFGVESATGIRFTTYSLPNAGREPKVIAAAISIEVNTLSEPIAGENGVYVIYVDNKNEEGAQYNNEAYFKNNIESSYKARANRSAYETLIDMANIKDNRVKFF